MIVIPPFDDPHYMVRQLLDVVRRGHLRLGLDGLKEIEVDLSSILASVRSSINTHAAIHTLPVEILLAIFQHALPSPGGRMPFNGYEEPRVLEEVRARVVLTQVCRRWRDIALGMASMWTIVDGFCENSSSAFLARSRQWPIQVYLRQFLSGRPSSSTLIRHGNRVRDLFLAIPKERRAVLPSSTVPEFPIDPTSLARLSIATDSRSFDDGRPAVDFDKPVMLFERPPPRLNTLILRNMCWIPDIPYENVTHLCITQGTPIRLGKLLAFLGKCSALEQLVMIDTFIAGASSVPPEDAILLPRLRLFTLGINHSHLSMHRLIQYILLPPVVTVRIGGTHASNALASAKPFRHPPFGESFDTLAVVHETCPDRLCVRASGPDPRLALLLDLGSLVREPEKLIAEVVRLENIVDFRLSVPAGVRTCLASDELQMPALKRFAYLANGQLSPGRSVDEVSQALQRFPPLSRLSFWSADVTLLESLAECGVRLSLTESLVLHYRPKEGQYSSDVKASRARLQQRAPDAKICSCSCEPPWKITGLNPAQHAYEWLI